MDLQDRSFSENQNTPLLNAQDLSLSGIPTKKLYPLPSVRQLQQQPMRVWHWIALVGIISLSAVLNFFRLQQNAYGNIYYASAVKSMLINWHNFFFVSFDPGGFVSVDKPPLGLWLQTFSAKLFGFSGFSLFLPQALAGVLAVVLVFHLVRRSFDPVSGLLASLIMAMTPTAVVLSRNNNLDMLLVLVVLLAAWAVVSAAEKGQVRWLLLGAALVGVGFNIKMLEAYLVVPALGLLYLLAAPRKWWQRAVHVLLALAVLLVVSLSWITAVDLTPASQRPYVGSSQTNSELELALGYNGINRLFQFSSGTKQQKQQPEHTLHQPSSTPLTLFQIFASDPQQEDINETTSESGGTGTPGALRLFTQPLGGQISWLLPLALISMLTLAWQHRWRRTLDERQRALILWGAWLLPMMLTFSIAVHMLIYYVVMMAPAISALVGIGLTTLWRDYRDRPQRDWRGWMLPLALLITGVFQTTLLTSYPGWSAWLSPLIIILATLAGVLLVIARVFTRQRRMQVSFSRLALGIGICAVLAAPFVWSSVSLTYPGNVNAPVAGPRQPNLLAVFQDPSRTPGPYTLSTNQQKLLSYLLANRGNTQFLMGTLNTSMAIPFILVTGQPVMALGGFNGHDPILTTSQLANDVSNGTVRFFLLPFSVKVSQNTMKLVPTGGNATIERWIATNCNAVPPQDWEPGYITRVPGKPDVFHPTDNPPYLSNGVTINRLYDCGTLSPRS